MNEGDVVTARVHSVQEWGLFVEVDGFHGFVQPTEVSWRLGTKATAVAKAGDAVRVVVLAIAPDRFSASLKQARPEEDPWRYADRLQVGSAHAGIVIAMRDWGTTIELDLGPVGVALRANTPEGVVVEIGLRVRAVVLSCDAVNRKLELELDHVAGAG